MRLCAGLVFVLLAALRPTMAAAQPTFESAGERALGMGGAFVAVADDATATHWNPAGLAVGGPAGMTIGWHRFQTGNPDSPLSAGPGRRSTRFTSLGTWPLGISYGTFEMTTLGAGPEGRSDVEVRTLRTTQLGGTVLQTIVDGLVVGATLNYVRGSVVSALSSDLTVGAALDRTDDVKGQTRGTLDLDAGLMADMGRLRVGLAWKNLRSPSFGDAAVGEMTLPRQARLGLAVLPVDGLTLAMDLDLETVDLGGDLRRACAVGGEGRIGQHLAVRSGLQWSLEGPRRLSASAGMSVAIRRGLWLDGHWAQRRDRDEAREFGVALRAGL
ncbi:MAG: conjugal transfer protein TraF [Acidobacteria bacterium]|nr:conjugal transfer protein TraF [Acidobacteriota bacterium]